jgi:hypothetical protein
MAPLDCYKVYLSLRNHFTRKEYDYHKHCGKTRVKLETFYKRKDRFWFEKISRNKNDREIVDFFVSNFVSTTDPQTVWIGNIVREGETHYTNWKRKVQSLSYMFRGEIELLFSSTDIDNVFYVDGNRHPIILKEHLNDNISIETMVILDKILGYKKDFDKKMTDPIWETVSFKMQKYSPFLNIDVFSYKRILKEVVL